MDVYGNNLKKYKRLKNIYDMNLKNIKKI